MSNIFIKNLQSLLQQVNNLHLQARSNVLNISAKSKKGEFSKAELADLGFLCRELRSRFEEVRKDIDATKVMVDRIFCIKSMSDMLATGKTEDKVSTDLCSARPHYKKSFTAPAKGTPEHTKFLKYFGLSDDGIDMGVSKPSWKKVCDHITELAELGKPIPDFIPKIFDDYTVIHRRK